MQNTREDSVIGFISSEHRQQRSRQYQPLGTRIELYHKTVDLLRHKHTYRQVQNPIFSQKHVWLSRGTISGWARGIHRPAGRINSFRSNPSPELAYVIGTVLGDGNLNVHGYNAEILLSVTDYDFAKEFSGCLAKILSRENPYRVRRSDKRNRWIVQGSSILLYWFLKRPWQSLKPWIEHCGECTASFLRAFYDGEGSVSGRHLILYNTRADLLLYVRDLLCKFGIESTGLNLRKIAGTELVDPTNGRVYVRNRDCFDFRIRARSLPQFTHEIGFTINRKQQRLIDAVNP